VTWPIRVRLAVVYGAVFLALTGLLEFGAYSSVHAAINSIVDRELATRLTAIEDHVTRHLERYPWPQMTGVLDSHPGFQSAHLAIRTAAGEPMFSGTAMSGVRPPAGLATVSGPQGSLRVLAARRVWLGRPYDIWLATDMRLPAAVLNRLWLLMLLSLPPLLALCAVVAYWMSGRALAPIQEIMAAARSIDSRHLSQRVAVPPTGDEVQQLAETFNGMLERIDLGVCRMREFTANASHELRTPVAIVRAAAEVALLRTHAPGEVYREALERILRESERNTRLIESMLELSRIDSPATAAEFHTLRLNESLSEACGRMAPLAASRGVRIHCEPAANSTEVLADAEQLRRLWLILLDNALKFTPADGAVAVRVLNATVEVADSGVGIAPEHQAHIFERFYRADKARSRSLGGAGLGLAIAKEIVRLHGASIRVRSAPGQGACFSVEFPRAHFRKLSGSANPSVTSHC
jgi:heavy metal sensor kinase